MLIIVVHVNMLHLQLIQDMYKLIQDKLVGVQAIASHCSQALVLFLVHLEIQSPSEQC